MAHPVVFADRVKETATTTGTSDFTLLGAVTGYQTFNAAFSTTTYFHYCIALQSGSEWEVGRGHLSGAATLVRDEVLASSNAGAATNFSAGTKDVFNTYSGWEATRDIRRGTAIASAYGQNLA